MIELLSYGVSLGVLIAVAVMVILHLKGKFKSGVSSEDLKSTQPTTTELLSGTGVTLEPSQDITEKWKQTVPSRSKKAYLRKKRK